MPYCTGTLAVLVRQEENGTGTGQVRRYVRSSGKPAVCDKAGGPPWRIQPGSANQHHNPGQRTVHIVYRTHISIPNLPTIRIYYRTVQAVSMSFSEACHKASQVRETVRAHSRHAPGPAPPL